jgi:hypothetical protein
MRTVLAMIVAATSAVACVDDVILIDDVPPAPTGLYYVLEPSGDPARPLGVTLRWDPVNDPNVAVYNVYSRAALSGAFGLRGSTTSPSFHDDGQPHLEYYVTAESDGGAESEPSASVVIDERLRLAAPAALTSVSLDAMIHLEWSDNAFQQDPDGFAHYRVYSTGYDLDQNLCGTSWALEGTSVAPLFLAGALVNGVPRCFAVSAISIEGFESLWSPLRYDTPRPDGRNLIVFAPDVDATRSGFRFFLDANGDGRAGPLELGIVGQGAQMDFTISRGTGRLFLTPERPAATARLYGTSPIGDLTDIDVAPLGGYGRAALEAVPGWGYVFAMDEGDGFLRYGGIRVTAVGADYVIFDWSYQTDPGNPELLRLPRAD